MNHIRTGLFGVCRGAVVHLLAGLALLLTLSGCDVLDQLFNKTFLDQSQPIYNKPTTGMIGLRPQVSIIDEPIGALPKDATDPIADDLQVHREDYPIAPGDRLLITIQDLVATGREEQLQRMVTDTGYLSLPHLKPPMFVAGLTELQLQDAVIKAYQEAQYFVGEPQVSVQAQTRLGRQVTFQGPFGTPGTFALPKADYRMLEGLGLVGGTPNSTAEWIYVIRYEGRDLVKPRLEAAGSEIAPPGGTTTPPGGATPLPGGAPLSLPGDQTGPGPDAVPPAPESIPPLAPTRPDVPDSLRQFNPGGLPGGHAENEPVTPRNGLPAGAGSPATPSSGSSGHWMIVAGKWAFVPDAPKPAAEGSQAAGLAPVEAKRRIIRIPLGPLRAGEARYDIVLRPNDIVVAPPPLIGEFYVYGNVSRPGVYSLSDRKLTVKQAIASAGWFGPLADPSRVSLTRRIGAEQEQIIVIDVGQSVDGRADEYYLKPYDQINVGTNPVAPFLAVLRNAFRATYGVGFVYDRNFADIDSFAPRNNPNH